MTDLFVQISEFLGSGIWVASLVFFRVGAAMALLPAFGEQVTPMRVKLAAALAFTTVIAPVAWGDFEVAVVETPWPALIFPEVAAGLVIGVLFRLLVIALQVAGAIAAQSTSLSQMFGGGLGAEPQPAISTLLVVSGLCLAAMAGLHIRIVEVFIVSFELFPPGQPLLAADLASWGVEKVAHAFALGLSLAGPFVVAALMYNLALGAINRAMPQLMVAFVGAPAISLGGLVLLMIVSPVMLMIWLKVFLAQTSLTTGGL